MKVNAERARRSTTPDLDLRVRAIKTYQHARFKHTYTDLLATPRYERATRFFLDELYGPHDFTDRDAQFGRVVPALVRLFPKSVVQTVRVLAELHALSEELDSTMGVAMQGDKIDSVEYQRAWILTGRREDRQRQISMMLEIGRALDRYTASLLMRKTLQLMRAPARAAGLSALQHFLEAGFDAFRAMSGASAFLQLISDREGRLVEELFLDHPAPGLL